MLKASPAMRLLSVILILIASVAECLMLKRVLIPAYKTFGEEATLKCPYELGSDRLYAVKWYKDNEEFYKYVPRFNPPTSTHLVDGVRVDLLRSNDKQIVLKSVTVRSTGGYRCEVTADAPVFSSVDGEGRMTVLYLPQDPPQITGHLREEYEVGNILDLNCTSPKSFPPAKLSWYINDNPIDLPLGSLTFSPALEPATGLDGHHRHIQMPGNLVISSLRLQLTLQQSHFGVKRTARVRCVARISPLFWQDNDELIVSSGGGYRQGNGHQIRHGNKKTHEDERDTRESFEEERYHKRINFGQWDDGEDDEGDEYKGPPTFQKEALVLLRGAGCSLSTFSKLLYKLIAYGILFAV